MFLCSLSVFDCFLNATFLFSTTAYCNECHSLMGGVCGIFCFMA